MELDVRTLMVAFSVNLFAGAIALPTIMGWRRIGIAARHAVLATGLQALGWAGLVMSTLVRNEWPDRLLSTLAMGAMSASLVTLWRAVRLWTGHGRPEERSPGLVVLWTLTVLMTAGYGLGFDHYPWRVGLANGVLGLLMLGVTAAALSHSPGTHRGWRAVIATSMAVMATVTFWRGVLGAFFTESYPFMTAPHPVNQFSALVSSVVLLLNSMALLMAYREEAERQLREQAITDGLTGLLNRRAWTERAEVLLADARRYGQPLGLMMIDIDHFKRVNDDHGHARGDQALQLVARMLREQLRSGDLAGRYGGEEFCVLLTHTREGPALSLDQRLRQCLRLQSEPELGFVLEYSAGLAALGENDRTLDDLLRRADAALYEAKRAGRAQVVLAAR
jgi:diguanylate cyclase (GGDEF)-like protein